MIGAVTRLASRLPPAGIAFLAGLALALPFQGSRGIYETSEGRYAECAREMLRNGSYFVPTLWGEPHLTKPPLTYWAIAGGMRVLGRNAWGARLYGALAFALCVTCVYELGRRLWTRRTAWMAAAVFATMPLAFFGANIVTTDILLCAWETGAMLCIVAAWRVEKAAAARRWVTAAWVLFGLGFLTKGPPALLPLAAVAVWRRRSAPSLPLITWAGFLLFVLIGASWFAGILAAGQTTAGELLRREVIGRVASSAGHNRAWYKAFSVYLPPLTAGLGAWFVVAVGAAIRERSWNRAVWARLRSRPDLRLLLLWFLIPLAVFAVSRSRLTLYVLPLTVPLALGLAAWIDLRGRPRARSVVVVATASAAALLAAKAALALVPNDHDMRSLADVCLRTGGARARYILVDRSRMNGLRFYLDGNLTRLSFGRATLRAEGRLRPFLDDFVQPGNPPADAPPYVLIVHAADRTCVTKALRVRGLSRGATAAWYDWEVWTLNPPEETPDAEHDRQPG